jgi:hypothetical protein
VWAQQITDETDVLLGPFSCSIEFSGGKHRLWNFELGLGGQGWGLGYHNHHRDQTLTRPTY